MTEEEQWWQRFVERVDDYILAIETEDDTYIGNIGLHKLEWENRQAMLGIVIGDKNFWGQGFGTDAVRTLLGWAFDCLNLNRVWLTVYDYNLRAFRCYVKCGFRHEGTLRRAKYAGGKYHDELIMGILCEEYRQQEEAD
jgi:RimJ/RimL family protein N-acetyltransferase